MRRLRSDILNGRIPPGAKLGFADLSARYDASTGVLREVLPRLVEQGLASSESQQGFRVVAVSLEDLRRLTQARASLESMVLRLAVEAGSVEWEANVVAAHHTMARTPRLIDEGLNPEWLALHERFHTTLLEGCGNPYLTSMATKLRSIAEVYRCWSTGEALKVHRDVEAEHQALAEAAVARDGEACARLITEHIELTTEHVVRGHVSRAGSEMS